MTDPLRVAIIVQAITDVAFFTVHRTLGITHQPELGRTSTEFHRFRMHPADYATELCKKAHSVTAVNDMSGGKLASSFADWN